MRTKLRSKVTLLFMTFALLLAIPAVALADIVHDQINDVDTNANETINLTTIHPTALQGAWGRCNKGGYQPRILGRQDRGYAAFWIWISEKSSSRHLGE